MRWLLVTVSLMAWATIYAVVAPVGSCPAVCDCKWKSGKRSVECMNRMLIAVPEPMDTATQLLDLSGNNLQILPHEAFARNGLVNLQKIYLRNCNIGQIHERAFKDLSNLVELDLSQNLLTQIPDSFKDVPFLRDLNLAHNPILKIYPEVLINLGSIIKLDLSRCDIRDVAPGAFNYLRNMEHLNLSHNKLREMPLSSLENLNKLKTLDLSDNPWICDCRLRDLKLWLEKNKLLSTPSCSAPTRLTKRPFAELNIEEFACKPEILPSSRHIEADLHENASVTCKTEALPSANINWYWNGRLMQNGSNFNSHQKVYIYEKNEDNSKKRSSLVLTNIQPIDSIEFYCVADNKGGNAEANFTVHVVQKNLGLAYFGSSHIIGVAVILLIIVVGLGLIFSVIRFRPSAPIVETKTPNTNRVAAGNEVHPAQDRPQVSAMENRRESSNQNDTKCNPISKPPRTNEIPYTTNHYEGRGSLVAAGGPPLASPAAADPDIITDTRPDSAAAVRPASGDYAREGSDSLYPSGIWDQMKMNQVSNLTRAVSAALPSFYNDRTPIIENYSVDGSQEELGYASRTFPRPHAVGAAPAVADAPYPPDYGLPVGGARAQRVWHRAPPVLPPLPPVAALRRVLAITRPPSDGCATDV